MAASSRTCPAVEAFLKDLNQCAVDGTHGSECAQFIPKKELQKILDIHIRDLLQVVSPDQLYRKKDIVKSYSQVFAVLISIGEGASISYFTSHELLCDRRLPFVDKEAFPLGRDFFDKFQLKQWMFCAPALTRHFEWTFDEYRILPFCREKESIVSGNSGTIYKISIPCEYDALSIPHEVRWRPSNTKFMY